MAENNDFHLVISDEENLTLPSNRTLQNTLSPPASQQFIRRAGGGNNTHQDPQNHHKFASPQVTDSISSFGHDFQSAQKQELNFPPENFLSPNGNWQGTFGSPSGYDTESHKKNQFVKKSKRTNDEGFVEDDHYDHDQRAEFGSGPVHYADDHRRYNEQDDENERHVKTQSDRYEGEEYGEYPGMEGSQEIYDDDRKGQSLRDSQLSGPLRYSKMTEEEAARAFENRKKELFSTYLKKGTTPKRSASKPGSPGGNSTRFFKQPLLSKNPQAESRKANRAEVQQQQDDVLQGKNTGFVIYNNKQTKSQNQQQQTGKFKAVGRENSDRVLNVKRVPSPAKKNQNPVPVAKQRRDSPLARNAVQQKQPLRNPPTPTNQQQGGARPQNKFSNPNASGKVNVDLKKSSSRQQQGGQSYFQNIQEVNETSESQQERHQHRGAGEQAEYNNVYAMSKMRNKNNEIMHDIHDLDEEIYRLERETGIRANSKPPAEQRGRPDSTDRQSHNQRVQQQDNQGRPRSRSLQREEKGNNRKPSEERGKMQKINELQGRYTDQSRDSIKDQIYQSYAVLNERGYEHHYDYLYERALVQRKCKDLLHEKTKEVKDTEDAVQCTFAPQINHTKYPTKRPDIITQTKNWQLEKEKQYQVNEKSKIEKELKDCTFYPNGMLEKDERYGFNPNDFYKRNIEWQKRKEAEDMRKQNEIHKAQTAVPERKKSHGSLSVSRVHDSQIISPTNAMNNSRGLTRNSSNKSLKSARDTKAERSQSAKKRDDSEKRKRDESEIRRNSYKSRPSAVKTEKQRSPLRERGLTQSSAHNIDSSAKPLDASKSLNSLHLQSQIMESYAILDGLQHMLSTKEKERQEKIIHDKENVSRKLKTISTPQVQAQENNANILNKPTSRGTVGKGGRATASPRKSPRKSPARTSTRMPNQTSGYEVQAPAEFVQNIVVRNNRYFIEERPLEKPQATATRASRGASRERSRSIESRKSKRGFSPAKEYKPSDMRGGSYVAASQAKKRKESPYKSKPVPKQFETSASKSNYSDLIRASPMHSGLNSPQNMGMGMFNTGPSPRYELNYVSKGLISPTTHALEKKYLDLLSQVSRVTKQLEHVSVENSHLQEDITHMQKRQVNSHPLYS